MALIFILSGIFIS